jgi:beta-hydroxyacyl-ACP dehydratase FabZ
MSDERSIEIEELLELLPHRFPFLLVDRIVDMEPGVRITGVKNVTVDEPLFGRNAEGGLMMPALLIIEAMAQTGAVLLMVEQASASQKLVYFAALNDATWQGTVRPGDQLRFDITVTQSRGRLRKVHGVAFVGDTRICEADLAAVVVDKETAVTAGG